MPSNINFYHQSPRVELFRSPENRILRKSRKFDETNMLKAYLDKRNKSKNNLRNKMHWSLANFNKDQSKCNSA